MKRLASIMLVLITVITIQSCDVLKQSVSTTSELYVGEYNGQPVKYEDKNGYIQHFIDLKSPGFYAEHIKGVTLAPVREFYGDLETSTTLSPSQKVIETGDGKKLYWIDLWDESGNLLIKPYTRELH